MIKRILFCAAVLTVGAWAQCGSIPTTCEQAARAELIFEGLTDSVEYARSVDGVTYTFVTFRVNRIFKGRVKGGLLTLRFYGGRELDGTFSRCSSVPLFDVGDRAVLMVFANGRADSPLAGWCGGRFRIEEGRVYTDAGAGIRLATPDRIAFVRGPESTSMDAGGRSTRNLPRGEAVTYEEFARWLTELSRRYRKGESLVESADPRVPFRGETNEPVGPPSDR